ncbi:SCO4225 family membrane protein [Streptomyces sp. NPDC094448]|uniref:SCO4225 family membrane protein n=1 Tax=Streptomyces sp. NPDC094448 TaxID=3366063 RepID=UPI003820F048
MNARTLYRLAIANIASAAYLVIVGGSVVVAAATTFLVPDTGLIWVWPALLTAPTSLFLVSSVGSLVPDGTLFFWPAYLGLVAAGALVQSTALGLLWHGLRRGARRLTASA